MRTVLVISFIALATTADAQVIGQGVFGIGGVNGVVDSTEPSFSAACGGPFVFHDRLVALPTIVALSRSLPAACRESVSFTVTARFTPSTSAPEWTCGSGLAPRCEWSFSITCVRIREAPHSTGRFAPASRFDKLIA